MSVYLEAPDGYKLVPADAIVLTKEDFDLAIFSSTLYSEDDVKLGTIKLPHEILDKIWSQVKPSLAEPTDFGAMVEAGAEDVTGRYVFKKVRYGGAAQWAAFVGVSVHFADWSDLIIPTLFCEGQVK